MKTFKAQPEVGKLKSFIVRDENETITLEDFQNKQSSNGQRITQV